MESTGSLHISQSKTHYRCYRVFIESLYRVYMESTWSLQGVCLLVKVKPITGVIFWPDFHAEFENDICVIMWPIIYGIVMLYRVYQGVPPGSGDLGGDRWWPPASKRSVTTRIYCKSARYHPEMEIPGLSRACGNAASKISAAVRIISIKPHQTMCLQRASAILNEGGRW